MAEGSSEEPTSPSAPSSDAQPKRLPKGVVLGKDGKPCRTCTSVSSWLAMTKPQTSSSSSSSSSATSTSTSNTPSTTISPDCPPDVAALGRSTWTLLHTLTATYPTSAPPPLQSKTRNFLTLFSELYPCWVCAEDFQDWMQRPGNEPQVRGREDFGLWMCRAHNEVNRKLGKGEFDCRRWGERWREGWGDGSCG